MLLLCNLKYFQAPESFALQLRLHRKGIAPIQYINIRNMIMQGHATVVIA